MLSSMMIAETKVYVDLESCLHIRKRHCLLSNKFLKLYLTYSFGFPLRVIIPLPARYNTQSIIVILVCVEDIFIACSSSDEF